jgi:hypothetical protein
MWLVWWTMKRRWRLTVWVTVWREVEVALRWGVGGQGGRREMERRLVVV